MGIKRSRRRPGPTLHIPDALLAALETVHGPLDPAVLAPAVARLNAGLTRERGTFLERYLRDPALRTAYATYYLCANAPKLWPVLDAMDWPGHVRVLELGCGPGTGIAALALWARQTGRTLSITATDLLAENLQAARRLARALDVEVTVRRLDLRSPEPLTPPYDLVLAMNVVNELPPEADGDLSRALGRWTQGGGRFVAIDPASRAQSRRALALRDRLVAMRWAPRFPCPGRSPCPAVAADEWCHGAWPFERPAFMEAIDQRVGTRREALKATCFVLDRRADPDVTGLRVVSDRQDEKGRSHLLACDGAALVRLERQRRNKSDATADFGDANRFDRLEVEGATPTGDRLRLGPDARCTRVRVLASSPE